jgi:4-hydroxybenzoate polyprenyltransferase
MGFGYGPFLFLLGWTVFNDTMDAPLWILIFLYFHEVFILITKDYRDVKGDRKYGIRTLPVVYGRERAASYNYVLYISPFIFVTAIAYSGFIDYNPLWLLATGCVIALPMFWLCSQNDLRSNVAGYHVYIIAFILVRIILAYTV